MTLGTSTLGTDVVPQCACPETELSGLEPNSGALRGDQHLVASSYGDALPAEAKAANAIQSEYDGSLGHGGHSFASRSAMAAAQNSIVPSQTPDRSDANGKVFALGVLGYDFGTEARRDSFKQLMPASNSLPANPYDARQMVAYLSDNLAEARSLIWTLNIELTPVYAIEPVGAFARDVYDVLRVMLAGEIKLETDADFIERVSIPGYLSGRTVRLFSGQVVPVIELQSTRGLYGWKTNNLVNSAMEAAATASNPASSAQALDPDQEAAIRATFEGFLNRVYYDLRNLGKTSSDRALNFAVTNAFQMAGSFGDPLAKGMQLDDISVVRSPFCRMDSDCWDVKRKFFDPENNNRAKRIFRYTIDVSDLIPVTMGEVRSWTSAV